MWCEYPFSPHLRDATARFVKSLEVITAPLVDTLEFNSDYFHIPSTCTHHSSVYRSPLLAPLRRTGLWKRFGRATASNVSTAPPRGGRRRRWGQRERRDFKVPHETHHVHFTSLSSVASDGGELCKAARKARRGGVRGAVGIIVLALIHLQIYIHVAAATNTSIPGESSE
jgi:hypothetical protein